MPQTKAQKKKKALRAAQAAAALAPADQVILSNALPVIITPSPSTIPSFSDAPIFIESDDLVFTPPLFF